MADQEFVPNQGVRRNHPLVYEIHTRAWLAELAGKYQRLITLSNIPDEEFAALARLGFTHIWMMGVWMVGREAVAHAQNLAVYGKLKGHTRLEDVCGSPYAVSGYSVPSELGGVAGLQTLRAQLHRLGLRLILDFVPNHVALDHPWVTEQSHRLVHLPHEQKGFFPVRDQTRGKIWIAHGKDPYFPPWTDTAQLDWRLEEVHQAMLAELHRVAALCDGVRVDMAMLVLQSVFLPHWQSTPVRSGATLASGEFWPRALDSVHKAHPGFLFIAEAYWGLEETLVSMGFDYAYDKQSYDHLVARRPAELRSHLRNQQHALWSRGVRFLENHDEPRVGGVASDREHQAWALLLLALPGLRLIHHGQMQGFRRPHDIRTRIRPFETENPEVLRFYRKLLSTVRLLPDSLYQVLPLEPLPAWEGNPSHDGFVAVFWRLPEEGWILAVVNLRDHQAQCRLCIPGSWSPGRRWEIRDELSSMLLNRSAQELAQEGLFLDLPGHEMHLFRAKTRL